MSEKDSIEAEQLVKHEMKAVGPQRSLSVPLKVGLGVGKNWQMAYL